jgi:hypothetical protein
VVERRHYASRERRRTAALDKSDQRVQVHCALVRQLLCQHGVEPGLAQPRAAPSDRVVSSAARRCLSAGIGMSSCSEIHASLAPPRLIFLPANSIFEEPFDKPNGVDAPGGAWLLDVPGSDDSDTGNGVV